MSKRYFTSIIYPWAAIRGRFIEFRARFLIVADTPLSVSRVFCRQKLSRIFQYIFTFKTVS